MREPYYEPQANFLKHYEKLSRKAIGENEDYLFFTEDGYVLYIIPKVFCLIDVERASKGNPLSKTFIDSFKKCEYFPAEILEYHDNSTWKEIAVIGNKNLTVWVQRKNLKCFPTDVCLEVAGEKQPVKVIYNEEVCGYIMPVLKTK